ncbi:hypothetical protein MIR68_010159 [Amoeboaphelidium protococcarum]|nr:hypothetical protein MIR68_010159 [Amoeboaphelidium protococcarum]
MVSQQLVYVFPVRSKQCRPYARISQMPAPVPTQSPNQSDSSESFFGDFVNPDSIQLSVNLRNPLSSIAQATYPSAESRNLESIVARVSELESKVSQLAGNIETLRGMVEGERRKGEEERERADNYRKKADEERERADNYRKKADEEREVDRKAIQDVLNLLHQVLEQRKVD